MDSKSQHAKQFVLESIRTGRWRPGQRLASERELAVMAGVNPLTLRRGLAELAAEGVIVKRPGVGNFVSSAKHVAHVAVIFPSYLLNNLGRNPIVELEMRGIAQAMPQREYAINPLWYRPEHFWEDAGQIVVEREIRGVILHPHTFMNPAEIRQLLEVGVHVVAHSHLSWLLYLRNMGISTFSQDREALEVEIVKGLVERGHRKIVLVHYSGMDLLPSLERTCRGQNLGEAREMVFMIPERPVGHPDFEALAGILDSPNRPTALVVPDEVAASWVFRACTKRGIRIPQDLSLAAMHDITPLAHPVPLSAPESIAWVRDRARMSAAHLKQLMNGESMRRVNVQIGKPMCWKESVGDISL